MNARILIDGRSNFRVGKISWIVFDNIIYYMPRFPKAFARRKSSANVFEEVGPEVPEPSFKVFERGESASKSFDGGVKLAKAGSPGRPKTAQLDTDNMFENLGNNR